MGEAAKPPVAPVKKPLHWVGSSREDIRAMSEDVKDVFGLALLQAQFGGKHEDARPLKGYKGAGVLEVVADDDGDTFRAVYTVKFRFAVYVLHVFQKKSKEGIKTPKKEIDLVDQRLKLAQKDHEVRYAEQIEAEKRRRKERR
jgi:phage-related protein